MHDAHTMHDVSRDPVAAPSMTSEGGLAAPRPCWARNECSAAPSSEELRPPSRQRPARARIVETAQVSTVLRVLWMIVLLMGPR